jgi:PAS domain-containing protein
MSNDRDAVASILSFPQGGAGGRAKPFAANDHRTLVDLFNNMSQGVLMFDADGRMIFCNQRYVEM